MSTNRNGNEVLYVIRRHKRSKLIDVVDMHGRVMKEVPVKTTLAYLEEIKERMGMKEHGDLSLKPKHGK